MSVLSAQCDRLRLWAKALDDEDMRNLARQVREAADTIWRLRDQNLELHDKVDELEEQNEQLREEITDLWPRAAFTMDKVCKATWIAELGEIGVEVEDSETSEY